MNTRNFIKSGALAFASLFSIPAVANTKRSLDMSILKNSLKERGIKFFYSPMDKYSRFSDGTYRFRSCITLEDYYNPEIPLVDYFITKGVSEVRLHDIQESSRNDDSGRNVRTEWVKYYGGNKNGVINLSNIKEGFHTVSTKDVIIFSDDKHEAAVKMTEQEVFDFLKETNGHTDYVKFNADEILQRLRNERVAPIYYKDHIEYKEGMTMKGTFYLKSRLVELI